MKALSRLSSIELGSFIVCIATLNGLLRSSGKLSGRTPGLYADLCEDPPVTQVTCAPQKRAGWRLAAPEESSGELRMDRVP